MNPLKFNVEAVLECLTQQMEYFHELSIIQSFWILINTPPPKK